MKIKPQYLPPRQSVIYGYTRRMLDETSMNAQSFAMVLAENYIKTTAPDVRNVPLALGDDLGSAMKKNAQNLSRYMDGTVKTLPADLEDAWVMSLPEPYRSDCERDLARRRGLLPIKIAEPVSSNHVASLSTLTREFSELVNALAPAMHDGVFNEHDRQFAKRILNESDDLIAAVLCLRKQITEVLPEPVANVR